MSLPPLFDYIAAVVCFNYFTLLGHYGLFHKVVRIKIELLVSTSNKEHINKSRRLGRKGSHSRLPDMITKDCHNHNSTQRPPQPFTKQYLCKDICPATSVQPQADAPYLQKTF